MTKEEAIDLLDNLIGMIEDNHNSDYDNALKMAIKSLEQEPFMNKPCIANQVCHEDKVKVIEKIRVEIEKQEKWLLQAGCTTYNVDIAFDSIKSVLAESEERYADSN